MLKNTKTSTIKNTKTIFSTVIFSYAKVWREVEKSYKLHGVIGEGGYGTIMKATCLATGNKVAIKHITSFSKNKYSCVRVIREILIMKALSKIDDTQSNFSSYFPKLLDVIIPQESKLNDIFLVMELETTDIYTLLHNGS
jgi:serine/threonine protein kinase